MLNFPPVSPELCCFPSSCRLCLFVEDNFGCLALGCSPAAAAAADVLRFLPGMMASLENRKERKGLGRCFLGTTSFRNLPGAEETDELRETSTVTTLRSKTNNVTEEAWGKDGLH